MCSGVVEVVGHLVEAVARDTCEQQQTLKSLSQQQGPDQSTLCGGGTGNQREEGDLEQINLPAAVPLLP